MSRIGKLPIPVPSGVTVKVDAGRVQVQGPKGTLSQALPEFVSLRTEAGTLVVERSADLVQARANHGLARALVRNMVIGVTKGFEKKLEVIGIGFRAEVRGKSLVLNLGYSHPVEYAIPDGVAIAVDKANVLTIGGIDKQRVGQVAAEIRAYRRPDSYKGKGVRYTGERIRIKAGKSAK